MTAPTSAVWKAGRVHQGRALGTTPGSRPPGCCALSGWISIAICVTSLPWSLRSSWLLGIVRVVVAAAGAGDPQLDEDFPDHGDDGGVVGQGVGRERLGQRGQLCLGLLGPGLELRYRDDLARVEHGAMPQAAQLIAAHREAAGLLGSGVGDVVHTGVGVGLYAELVGPEAVDDVEGGDVELHGLPHGELKLRGLEAAELRVAVGPDPLLADHLDLEDVRRMRLPDRLRALTGPRPLDGDQLDGAEYGQREH